MARTFELKSESRSSIEQFRSALVEEAYWRQRLAFTEGGTATLDSLDVETDGTVRVAITFSLIRDRLPTVVTHLTRGDLQLHYGETWSPSDDGCVRGQLEATVPGAPVSGSGTVVVSPTPQGSVLDVVGTVGVRIPLVGGAVERFLGAQLVNGVREMQAFTTAWVAERDA